MDTKKLRQKILDLAIHGKLVPQDPADEPASVLLQRIRTEKERLIKEGKIKRSRKSAKTSDTPHYENVPQGWAISTLGEIFTLQAGKNITAEYIKEVSTKQQPYECYGGNGVRGFVASYNRVGSFPIIGRQGALCGNVNMAKGKFFATEHAVVVENYCDTDVIWAYYALTALNLNQYATATAQPGLSVAVLNDVHIQIPPPKEQARISKAIEYLFALIVQVEQSKENLQTAIKQAKNKILELAISGKLVPQDPTDEPASELLKRINPKAHITCDNEHNRKLPNTWCCPTINEVFTINPKNKVLDNINAGFVPMAYIDDGYRGTFKYEKRKWADIKIGFTHFADNDIAIAKISPCLENRKSMILKNLPNGIGAGTTELYVFRPLCVNPKYALYFFKSNLFIQHCVGTFNGVVGQQRVAKNIIKEIIFPFPPLPEQQRIVSKIEELFALFEKIEVD